MTAPDNTNRFGDRADAYTKGRAGYADAAIDYLAAMLPAGGTVADIGAGTGLVAEAFLARGVRVAAVEPNAAMREKAAARLGDDPRFSVVGGSAEATGLDDCSVDLIVAGSAFHWFDADHFRAECARIGRPDAAVALLYHVRGDDAFTRRQCAICRQFCDGFTSLCNGYTKTLPRLDSFFPRGWQRRDFDCPLPYTRGSFIARSLSSSYAPPADDPRHAQYRAALAALMDEFSLPEQFLVPNQTVLFWGKL